MVIEQAHGMMLLILKVTIMVILGMSFFFIAFLNGPERQMKMLNYSIMTLEQKTLEVRKIIL